MKCNQCGTENVEGTRFCKTCGNAMGNEQMQPQMSPQPMPQQQNNNAQDNGNGIACMVLGIVSVVFGCAPLIGLVCGIIAIIMNRKDMQMGYESSYHKAGLVCGIVGVCLGALSLIYWSICIVAACTTATTSYNHYRF